MKTSAPPANLLLYDGVCGLCHGFVRFVLARDHGGIFRFAPLQGEPARRLLAQHGLTPTELDSVVLVLDAGTQQERLLVRSAAAIEVLRRLDRPWPLLAEWLGALPPGLRDGAYRWVARHRYRIFGRVGDEAQACPLPSPAHRNRFL
jgi:predicted DCC family thiol-disulfide oxidoreductase YuxK